jgi:hypothetical protein
MPEYEDIRSSLKTGDVVLMGGSSIFSRAIRRLTRSKWSHVGMVMKVEEFDTLLLWESTTNGHDKDVQTGEVKRGVQLVPLSKRVKDHTGNIAFRPLSRALNGGEITKLNKFRHSVKDKPYDFDGLELLRSAIDSRLFWSNREDLSAYFCSELIAETYQTLGFLSEALPSNEYTPNDFSSSAAVPLDFQGGMSLDDEIIVQEEA